MVVFCGCHDNLHACTVSHFHADDLEFHFTHAANGNTITSGCKQQQLFLQVHRKRQNYIPEVPTRDDNKYFVHSILHPRFHLFNRCFNVYNLGQSRHFVRLSIFYSLSP